jgi:glycosyltransferase involved in cell wall biosynthesis
LARIALILRPDRGGAFTHVVQLSHALTAEGHDVFVCGPFDPDGGEFDATVVPLKLVRPVSPHADLAAAASFARIVRRLRPDLIHAHGSKGGVIGRIGRLASPRTPLVLTPHLFAFANYFARPAQRRIYRVAERLLAPLATRVIAVCEAERREAESIGRSDRIRVVHNGVEPVRMDATHPIVAELGSEGPVLCTVAELRASKGVVTLVEAMGLVIEEHPEARLAVAGDGEERARIDRRISELNLQPAIRMLGRTPGADSVLAGATAFVNPAYAEAFPYTVIEAMSGALPVIATDVGGTSEATGTDGGAGLLVEPGDAAGLAAAISAVLSDPAFADRLGSAARARYEQQFTTEHMTEGILGVYAELGITSQRR